MSQQEREQQPVMSWETRPNQDMDIAIRFIDGSGNVAIQYSYQQTPEQIKEALVAALLRVEAIHPTEAELIQEMDLSKADGYLQLYMGAEPLSFLSLIQKYAEIGLDRLFSFGALLADRRAAETLDNLNQDKLISCIRMVHNDTISRPYSAPPLHILHSSDGSLPDLTRRFASGLLRSQLIDYTQAKALLKLNEDQLNKVIVFSRCQEKMRYTDFYERGAFVHWNLFIRTNKEPALKAARCPESKLYDKIRNWRDETKDKEITPTLELQNELYRAMQKTLQKMAFGQLTIKSGRVLRGMMDDILSDLEGMHKTYASFTNDPLFAAFGDLIVSNAIKVAEVNKLNAKIARQSKACATMILRARKGIGEGLARSIVTDFAEPTQNKRGFYTGKVLYIDDDLSQRAKTSTAQTSILLNEAGGTSKEEPTLEGGASKP
jgi:hypothetical protein